MKVWGWWVGVGQCCFGLLGLGLVGWGWSGAVCAGGFGVGGLELVGRGLCWKVWGGSVVVSACRYGIGWLG